MIDTRAKTLTDGSDYLRINPMGQVPVSVAEARSDLGDRFVVQRGLSQADAERLVAEMEGRGNKQTYWADPEGSEEVPA